MDAVTTIGLIVTVISTIACPIIAHGKGQSAVCWFSADCFSDDLA